MTEADGCTLCDLPLGETAVRADTGKKFCCRGCREVHGTLAERDDLSTDADLTDLQDAVEQEQTEIPDGHETTFLRVDGMHCATCETFIEARAGKNDDVSAVDASYITDTVRVNHDPDAVEESDIKDTLTGMGYRAYARDDPLGKQRAEDDIMIRLIVGILFGMTVMMKYIAVIYPTYFENGLYYPADVAAFLSEMLAGTSVAYFYMVMGFLTTAVLFYTGGPILKGAIVSIKTREPNMDLLVALAASAAYVYSTIAIFVGESHIYYDVTIGIILVVTAGSYYENQVKREATDRLADLTEAQVSEATLYDGDETTTVSITDLTSGDRILVRAGERVPVDGQVVDGEGTVDEAVVTGESLPVPKAQGDQVVGGSLLQDGSLVVEVGAGATSSVDRITDMVWNLQSANHGIQQLADRLATIFVPLVLALAVVVGLANLALGVGITGTLLVALTVLIVSCPCALGLATPLAIATSVKEALERGIVVFDETIFERLRDVDIVVFDKTGTLTTGKMQVLDSDGPTETFERAALLETRSSHPIAAAIAEGFDSPGTATPDGGEHPSADGGVEVIDPRADHSDDESEPTTDEATSRVSSFESYATGVGGTVDGVDVLVGHLDLFEEQGWTVPEDVRTRAEEATKSGSVPVVVGEDGQADGVAVVGDDPREEWEAAVEALADDGIEVAVLTGDDEAAAESFGDHPAIDHVFAGVPPEGKAETVRHLGEGRRTVMVGDGTNDAPALASADLGIALGSGTALAADAADVAIVTDDLDSLQTVFALSEAANRRVKQNIGWAFVYNGIAIPLAVAGLINPLFAAVAMAISSSLVVTNSSRSLL